MGSKGRGPPPNLRHPPPGPGLLHPDRFGPPIRNPPGDFLPFDRLPPPEIMEQKIAAQHQEMQKLLTENQKFATTHATLRRELAAAQQDLEILRGQIDSIKTNREQDTRGLADKIARIEAELQAAEPIKMELQQAQGEARTLFTARQELIVKVQMLTQDLQRAHADVQQIPPLLAELDSLKKEYQQCRATYERERKSYNEHIESLQVMEKNYMTMTQEMDKLRAELANTSNTDRRAGGPYGGSTGFNESDAANTYASGQNMYGDGYGIYQQGRGAHPTGTNVGGVAAVTSPLGGAQPVPPSNVPSYDAQRGYRVPAGHGYDAQMGQTGSGYDPQRAAMLAAYEAQRSHGYDALRAAGYDAYRGTGYDGYGAPAYDMSSKANVATQGQVAPHGSSTPPGNIGGPGYDAAAQGGNPARR